METRTEPRRGRRRLLAAVALAGVMLVAASCQGTWGIRESYRNYITGTIADGTITTQEGATWLDGPPTGKGPFRWPVEYSTFDPGTETGEIQFGGTVSTKGHPHLDGYVLDVSFSRPRLVIAGDVGTLYADLNYRPFVSFNPPVLPTYQAAVDVPFATVNLSSVVWTLDGDNNYRINDAPMVGIDAAMQLIGFDQFYGTNVQLDPFSAVFSPSLQPPFLAQTPDITVSKTTDLKVGDQITVWGTGFDPNANTGTRPPLSGQKSGNYVIFGKFADVWRPSAGAPSSARTAVVQQKWALPPASRAILDPAGTDPTFATIDANGRWKITLTVGTHAAATGNYGVYTFGGSGAVNASHEFYEPVTLAL